MHSGFYTYLEFNEITHQTTCVHTSELNKVAERKNRHILEIPKTLMFIINLPKSYWRDAVLSSVYLINKMHLRVLDFRSPL